MLQQMGTELFKLRKRWLPYIMLGLLVAFVALFSMINVILYATAKASVDSGQTQDGLTPDFWLEQMRQMERATSLPQGLVTPFATFQGIGSILLVIMAGLLVGSEYTWGTVRTNVARGVPRASYLGAKVLVLVLLAIMGLAVTAVVGTALALPVDRLIGGASPSGFLDGAFAGKYLASLVRTILATLPVVMMTAMVAVLTRGPTAAIAIGLVTLLLEGPLVGLIGSISDIVKRVTEYTVGYNTAALMQLNNFTDASGAGMNTGATVEDPVFWRAAVIVLVYTALFLVLAFRSFRSRDLTTSA